MKMIGAARGRHKPGGVVSVKAELNPAMNAEISFAVFIWSCPITGVSIRMVRGIV